MKMMMTLARCVLACLLRRGMGEVDELTFACRDPDLRAAAEGLMLALKSAGIEVDPQQVRQSPTLELRPPN